MLMVFMAVAAWLFDACAWAVAAARGLAFRARLAAGMRLGLCVPGAVDLPARRGARRACVRRPAARTRGGDLLMIFWAAAPDQSRAALARLAAEYLGAAPLCFRGGLWVAAAEGGGGAHELGFKFVLDAAGPWLTHGPGGRCVHRGLRLDSAAVDDVLAPLYSRRPCLAG